MKMKVKPGKPQARAIQVDFDGVNQSTQFPEAITVDEAEKLWFQDTTIAKQKKIYSLEQLWRFLSVQIKHSSIIEEKMKVLDEEEEGVLNEVESFTERLGTGTVTPESEQLSSNKSLPKRSQSIMAPVSTSKRLLKVDEINSSDSNSKSKGVSHIQEASDEDSESRLDNVTVGMLGGMKKRGMTTIKL